MVKGQQRRLKPEAGAVDGAGRSITVYLALAVASALAVFVLYRAAVPFLMEADLTLKDSRLRMRGVLPPDPRVAIVAVDSTSVKSLGRWPWSRDVTARVISSALAAGARVVAIDMVFSEPQSPREDGLLAGALAVPGRVVAGYFFREEPTEPEPASLELLMSSRIALLRLETGANRATVPEFPFVDLNTARVGRGTGPQGFFNQLPDRDGVIRSTPLLGRFRGDLYPSLPLAAAAAYLSAPVAAGIAPYGVSSLEVGGIALPVAEDGRLNLSYYGSGGTIPVHSAADLMNGRLPAAALRDRLVVLGVTEAGVADLRTTPLDPSFPGVGIIATAAANILEQRFLIRDSRSYAVEIAALFLLPPALVMALSFLRKGLLSLAVLLAAEGGFFLGNYTLFARYGYDTSILFPALSLGVAYLTAETYRGLVRDRQARYLKRAFSTYVSADLVRELVKRPELLKLGGDSREVSVVISDIRRFTTIAEQLGPERVVTLLSRYLSAMTEIVMAEGGTLIQYVGDEIMALFNAPLATPDHAARACRCALRMMERLETLNGEFRESGLPELEIGIGITTGEAIVGNIGAERRFQYGAVGDTVNLASRLEGLNKYLQTHLLASSATVTAAAGSHSFREIDRVRVKGRAEVTVVYELLPAASPSAAEFGAALGLYRAMRFSEAHEAFLTLAHGTGDPVARVYLSRCAAYLTSPPAGTWDGVYLPPDK